MQTCFETPKHMKHSGQREGVSYSGSNAKNKCPRFLNLQKMQGCTKKLFDEDTKKKIPQNKTAMNIKSLRF